MFRCTARPLNSSCRWSTLCMHSFVCVHVVLGSDTCVASHATGTWWYYWRTCDWPCCYLWRSLTCWPQNDFLNSMTRLNNTNCCFCNLHDGNNKCLDWHFECRKCYDFKQVIHDLGKIMPCMQTAEASQQLTAHRIDCTHQQNELHRGIWMADG